MKRIRRRSQVAPRKRPRFIPISVSSDEDEELPSYAVASASALVDSDSESVSPLSSDTDDSATPRVRKTRQSVHRVSPVYRRPARRAPPERIPSLAELGLSVDDLSASRVASPVSDDGRAAMFERFTQEAWRRVRGAVEAKSHVPPPYCDPYTATSETACDKKALKSYKGWALNVLQDQDDDVETQAKALGHKLSRRYSYQSLLENVGDFLRGSWAFSQNRFVSPNYLRQKYGMFVDKVKDLLDGEAWDLPGNYEEVREIGRSWAGFRARDSVQGLLALAPANRWTVGQRLIIDALAGLGDVKSQEGLREALTRALAFFQVGAPLVLPGRLPGPPTP